MSHSLPQHGHDKMLIYFVVRQNGTKSISTLRIHNQRRVGLVNKCCVIDERCLFFNSIERGTPGSLSLAALAPTVP